MKSLNNYIKEGFYSNIGNTRDINLDAVVRPWLDNYNKQTNWDKLKLSGEVIDCADGDQLVLAINNKSILEDGHLPAGLPFRTRDTINVVISTTDFKSFENLPEAPKLVLEIGKNSISDFKSLKGYDHLALSINNKSLKGVNTNIPIYDLNISADSKSVISKLNGLTFEAINYSDIDENAWLRISFSDATPKDISRFFTHNKFNTPVAFSCYTPTDNLNYLIDSGVKFNWLNFYPDKKDVINMNINNYSALWDKNVMRTLDHVVIGPVDEVDTEVLEGFAAAIEHEMRKVYPGVVVDLDY